MSERIRNPFEYTQTNATLFLLPPLKLDMKEIYQNGFWNAYIGDENHDSIHKDGNLIYTLFRPPDNFLFGKMLGELEERNIVIDDYDYEEGFCVIVLKFPKKYDRDFDLIKESKYSETSKEFQQLFPMEMMVKNSSGTSEKKNTIYNRVFNKLPELKEDIEKFFDVQYDSDQEYWPKFEDKETILSIDRILRSVKSK